GQRTLDGLDEAVNCLLRAGSSLLIGYYAFKCPDLRVSRWGKQGPLEPGDWVMKGGANFPNYVLSGKWQPGLTNRFAPPGIGQEFVVPPYDLAWPPGFWGILKGPVGQRIYVGPGLPPATP